MDHTQPTYHPSQSTDGITFKILGPVQIHDHHTGQRIEPAGAKQRALLGALTAQAGQVISIDRLIDELWGERPPACATNALQAHIARLRRLVHPAPHAGRTPSQPHLITRPLGYSLHTGNTPTDAQHFHQLAARGRALATAHPAKAITLLREALSLWRGPALEGTGTGAINTTEAQLLDEARLTAFETLYTVHLSMGDAHDITAELQQLTQQHPLREHLHVLLITALHHSGRTAEAHTQYHRAQQHLHHQLGIQPSPALHTRIQSILNTTPGFHAEHRTSTDHGYDTDTAGDAAHDHAPRTGARTVHESDDVRNASSLDAPLGQSAIAPADMSAPGTTLTQSQERATSTVRHLQHEIAQLRHHVEQLTREHHDLTDRLNHLAQVASTR